MEQNMIYERLKNLRMKWLWKENKKLFFLRFINNGYMDTTVILYGKNIATS